MIKITSSSYPSKGIKMGSLPIRYLTGESCPTKKIIAGSHKI